MTVSSEQLVEILRAAGEPTRLRILALLAHEELSVLELGRILDQSQPRVSRHLVEQALALVDPADAGAVRDVGQLAAVRAERSDAAASYFARNAARWDEIRSLYVDEAEVEAAVLAAAGAGPFDRLIDLGAGTGRMLTLLGGRAQSAVGLDLSQQMLNIARNEVAKAGLAACELRHGDIFATRLPDGAGDLVTVHQVLHYLGDPAAAVAEAARLTAPGGKLVIVDFAPHELEFLREQHQHRRLGFSDEEMHRWLAGAGLEPLEPQALAPARAGGLTVKVGTGGRAAKVERGAAWAPKRLSQPPA